MSWPYRVIVIVPASSRTTAETASRAINSTGPNYAGDAFTVTLSASGDDVATHYGLYTSATDAMIEAMATALPQIEGVMYWRHGVDGDLQASNVTEPTGQKWGWEQSLAAAGLAEVHPPSPYV